jgi:RNA polymerase sigma-70 factor (ECF subfamily)
MQLSIEQQKALVERIRCGDSAAETELVHQFGRRVFVMACVRIRDREGAKELAQDVLVAVIRSLRAGKLENAEKLSGFIQGTARNLINNYLRSRCQRPMEEPLTEELAHIGFEKQVENTERLRLVNRALGKLEVKDRRILVMTLVDGLKPGEIAEKLGLSDDVVRTRKLRAIKKVTNFVKSMSRI